MFVTPQADQQRLPVALLSGFLGSGKTTLVNALLRDKRAANTAVAVNEFGEIPLDSHLIESGPDRIITLANGCLCCNLGGDMQDSMLRLFASRQDGTISRFDRLIIEPSGLADPAPIAQAILRNPVLSRIFRLESILCAVDALFAERHFTEYPETRKQVALGDRIVITKSDLVDAATLARVRACIRDHNPLAPIFVAASGQADVAAMFPPAWLDSAGTQSGTSRPSLLFAEDATQPASPSHSAQSSAVCLATELPLDWSRFDIWLRGIRLAHADQLLRLKGVLGIAGNPAPLAIGAIHHVLHVPVQLSAWPPGLTGTRLVFITRGLPAGTLEQSWGAALPGLAVPR